jgi:hypothetical protein
VAIEEEGSLSLFLADEVKEGLNVPSIIVP